MVTDSNLEPGRTDTSALGSRRLVHDLRAPLVIAIGYLDELRIFKKQLLIQLSTEDSGRSLEERAAEIAKEADDEIGLCVDMIQESLEELDGKISDLRNLV